MREATTFKWFRFRNLILIAGLVLTAPALATGQDGANPQIQRTAHFAEILTGDAPDDVADLRSMQQQIQTVHKRAMNATVGVMVGPAQGSGVIVSEDGLILTAGHVIGAPGLEVTVLLNDGRRVKGVTLGTDRGIDSGAIQITTKGKYDYLPMRDSSTLNEGEWVLVVGHAGGIVKDRAPALRLGRILGYNEDVIETDATLVGGDSGGPLLDLRGNVIGINSRIGSHITANLHVPTHAYLTTLDRLKKSEVWGRVLGSQPYLGVRCDADKNDVIVIEVTENSPAADAGIRQGDRILSFGGRRIKNFNDLKLLVNQFSPGDSVPVKIERGGRQLQLNIELIDRRSLVDPE